MRKILNPLFAIEVVFFILVIIGIIPRAFVPYFVAILLLYVLSAPLDDAVVFFARSIPLFLAIPITAGFDNFNTWRILSAVIFLRWLLNRETVKDISTETVNFLKRPWQFIKNHPAVSVSVVMLILAAASLVVAPDKIAGIKKIILFVNLSLVGIVAFNLIKNSEEFGRRLIKNISIPLIIATVAGFAQLATTYLMDIYQFMALWGEKIQCIQFGQQWCNIAVHVGNTWLAYYGEQLSLRVFSLFPDSHSFPVFLLLGLPAFFALSFHKMFDKVKTLKEAIATRATFYVLWLPLIFLIAILTGTRGIWAASVGVVLFGLGIMIFQKYRKEPAGKRNMFTYIYLQLLIFFMLFAVAYPIFVSPQFLVSKGNFALFGKRIGSIVDFGETSNAQRIEIWKKSFISIEYHPVLGVGIGNFPVVLAQDVKLAKAGSSAHNLYIHLAAEMGILALLAGLWFIWLLIKNSYRKFVSSQNNFVSLYFGASLIFLPWVFGYLLTDVAIFDERAFLMFVLTVALIFGLKTKNL